MRFIVCVFIGLVIGAISAITAASILSHRHAYPRALMRVMQHQLGSARDAARDSGCAGNPQRLSTLGILSVEIAAAVPHGNPPERVFVQYLADLRRQIGVATSHASECAKQAHALTDIANACYACHRDYR